MENHSDQTMEIMQPIINVGKGFKIVSKSPICHCLKLLQCSRGSEPHNKQRHHLTTLIEIERFILSQVPVALEFLPYPPGMVLVI